MKLIKSLLCTFCEREEETLDYLFWSSHNVSSFILAAEQWSLDRQFTLSKEDIFFGYFRYIKHPFNFLYFAFKGLHLPM